MADEPEDFTRIVLREIQETLADHTKRFDRVEARLQHIETQMDDLSVLVTHSLGQSSETKFRQSQQQRRLDELTEKINRLTSEKEPR
jgi:uncharacterized coiled-coil protein SlyX